MRNYSKNAGFDRVLMAVAATFLTVSTGSALAQSSPAPKSAAELSIDAGVPVPDKVELPPVSVSDFKSDTLKAPALKPATATAIPAPAGPPAADNAAASATTPSADTAKSDAGPSDTAKSDTAKSDTDHSSTGKSDSAETTPTDVKAGETKTGDLKTEDADKAATAPAATTPAATASAPAAEPAASAPAASASAPADAAPKLATVAPTNPVADQLREMLTEKSSHYFDRKAERVAVEKFYAARDYAPLWSQAGAPSAIAKSVTARLTDAAAEGLNPADYPVPDFAAATSPQTLAEAELKMTASMLDYARHAENGRMHWSQLGGDVQYPDHASNPADVLAKVTTAADASAALDSYNPPHKLYRDLRAKLAELRGESETPKIKIAEGPTLRYSAAAVTDDPRVPQLRARLGITADADSTAYDSKVADAVRDFQRGAGLGTDGILGNRTVAALNTPKQDRVTDTIIVNMERLRWLPRQLGAASLGDAYVILNIPDFTLKVMQHDAQLWSTRVVVGKPGKHATPMLTETMKFITVNPTWNVPPSIIYNEYLPALQQDPNVLERMGLKLERGRDGSIHISQPPGAANALGRIRFNFPNKFLVYQHDTPDKNLFKKDVRAFSHGCMRVQNPDEYAETLLKIALPDEHYTAKKIRSMYGSREININFPTPIPVNITYQTAFVDQNGKLQLRRDIYGDDAAMLKLLDKDGKDLERVVAHAQPNYSRPRVDLPQGVAFNDSTGGIKNNQPSFFEMLFGAPNPPPSQPDRRHYRR
ncbi:MULTISPECIES: L,D-transpeptidase family protein [Rhodopseudomonas]|uniref:Peptidoglycan-binding protein n=1 Tax=Rhodopseudomonas palustris TaxID=1076 RepID=A0A0D7EJH9_RHOPL|nr:MULTISPECIES: L,D-transpeptidase family protein [Rhodopseudomonas]KIZ40938.1 peptidoglycan-binding protein [Rhodopseudomonas palustris]MDF3813521.1 L,D-transpeptidase family protein [Rhodopseudomonas sp. BAL398]WOK15371.1 L,D-transpeptidase family protein [Rhodopseudomonas sp. BAL398]